MNKVDELMELAWAMSEKKEDALRCPDLAMLYVFAVRDLRDALTAALDRGKPVAWLSHYGQGTLKEYGYAQVTAISHDPYCLPLYK